MLYKALKETVFLACGLQLGQGKAKEVSSSLGAPQEKGSGEGWCHLFAGPL